MSTRITDRTEPRFKESFQLLDRRYKQQSRGISWRALFPQLWSVEEKTAAQDFDEKKLSQAKYVERRQETGIEVRRSARSIPRRAERFRR